jgi:hypothetical protein
MPGPRPPAQHIRVDQPHITGHKAPRVSCRVTYPRAAPS